VKRVATSSSSTTLTYTVTANTPGVTFSTMSSDLTNNVESGQFNTNLNKNAATMNATALIGCSSALPSTTDSVSTTSSDDSSDDKLSGGAIAGIVIAIVFVVVLVAFGFYYFFLGKSSSGGSGSDVQTSSSAAGDGSSTYKKKSVVANQDNPVFGISAISSSKHQNMDDANM